MDAPYRLGVDIGGTFIDFALRQTRTGGLRMAKRLADPSDLAAATLAGIDAILGAEGAGADALGQVVHATTIGSNTVIERAGARVGLVLTDGFRDLPVMQRQLRYSPFDLMLDRHEPLVRPEDVIVARERLRADGSVHRPLDEEHLRRFVAGLAESGVETVAVCLLHSYVDAAHERRVAEVLADAAPDLPVFLSSDVAPLMREYERMSTTVINAYIQPAFSRYLRALTDGLAERGFRGGFYVLQANGGLATPEQIVSLPVRALESGPAGGVIMAAAHARAMGIADALAFDMGGTTAKASAIRDGEAPYAPEMEIDRKLMRPGSGLPLLAPSVDIVEIGAGGGSIAAAELGAIVVGPQSAGADPGPACYGSGGLRPTVTDANLVLGYLSAEYFNAGAMALDVAAARAAIEAEVAEPLGLPIERAAWGVHEAVTESMCNAIRAVSIERGRDPRLFTLIASGGSGPVHAARVARGLGIPRVVIPRMAGVMSALGLLQADVRFDVTQTVVVTPEGDGGSELSDTIVELESRVAALLDSTRLSGARRIARSVDMRYPGQGHVIEVDWPDGGPDELRAAFAARYTELYGDGDGALAPEVTGARVAGSIGVPGLQRSLGSTNGSAAAPRPRSSRPVYFPEHGGFGHCPAYRRDDLRPGATVAGPAVVEDVDSTTVLLPGDVARVDAEGSLIVAVGGE